MDTKINSLALMGLGMFLIVLSFIAAFAVKGIISIDFERAEMKKYDGIIKINCGSDSMGLTLSCDDLVYFNYVQIGEELETGRIYIYENKNNGTTIHRLVGCVDKECNTAIFKGDNNRVSELVEKDKIIKKVEMVEYR